MRIAELVINVSDITDACALGENSTVLGILAFSEEVVAQGGLIILQLKCVNAAPKILAIYRTLDEVREWKDDINRIQEELGRKSIL